MNERPGQTEPERSRSLAPVSPPAERVEPQQEVYPPDAVQGLLDVERQRIQSYDRRTEVARRAIDASDEADKRHFEFQLAKLDVDKRADERRHRLACWIIGVAGTAGVGLVALCVFMGFFGTPEQSSIGLHILSILAVGGAGYGIVAGLVGMLRRLMR